MRFLRRSYRHVRASRQPSDPRETVESSIETQNSIDPWICIMARCTASRARGLSDPARSPGSLDCRLIHRNTSSTTPSKALNAAESHPAAQSTHSGEVFPAALPRRSPTFSTVYQFFQPTPGIGFMRMGGAHQIHGNVGVDKDHGCTPDP